MSNSIAPGSSADVNVQVRALTDNPNVPVTYKTIILKKNLVNGVNTLTQEMMSAINTKYVIKYDYVLGENITVPDNCVLEFDGGSISGGIVNTSLGYVINMPSSCYGVVYNYLEIEKEYIDFTWFYKSTDADYSNAMTLALSAAHTLSKPIFVPEGKWQVELVDIIYDNITIYGCGEASVLYNHTWQNWTFRTDKDYIEIYNLKFEAIPHTEVGGRSYADEESDNGACAILAKGSYCTFHDLFIEEFYLGIFFGGDYLSSSNMQDGNSMYNIKCHNINFNSVAWQNNFVAHDIYGDCGTFIKDGYDGGASGSDVNKDGTPRTPNPSHLIYLVGSNNNVSVYNITSFDCKGGGSTLAVKGVANSHIHNITAWKSAVIQTNNCVGVEYEGICAFEQNTEGRYVIQATNITKSSFKNIFFKDSTYYPIFRVGPGCDDVSIKDVAIYCYIASISGSYVLCMDLLNSNKVIVEDVNIIFPNISIPEGKRYIRVGSATVIRGGNVPYNYYVYNPNHETFTIEDCPKVPINDPNGIFHANVTNYTTVTPEVLSDRNRIIPNSGGFIRELINISNDKQFCLANIFRCSYIDKEYIIINSGTSSINIRITDIDSGQTVHSNYAEYASYPLAAGNAIKLQIVLLGGHLIINKTNLFTN